MEQIDTLMPILSGSDLLQLQQQAAHVFACDAIIDYIVTLTEATRQSDLLLQGVSPRGSLALLKMAKAHAFYVGRNFVTCDDVFDIFYSVINHRILLSTKAKASGLDASDLAEHFLSITPTPSL